MLQTRVIPVLLLRNKGLVKTIRFDNARYIGDPINAVKIFNDKEVDELIFLDIDASKKKQEPDFELLQKLATECFMPFAYGGGIKTLNHIQRLYALGVEKIILNSVVNENEQLITQAAKINGQQSICISIDIKKNLFGKHKVYSHIDKKLLAIDMIDFIKKMQDLGAGELFINNVDLEGTMKGFDIPMIRKIVDNTKIPVVFNGSLGNLDDIKQVANTGASGVGAGSAFLFHGPLKGVLINYPTQQQLKNLLQ